MIILKPNGWPRGTAPDVGRGLTDGVGGLAAEQRNVRAEFVFMMGGELADAPDLGILTKLNEEAEAAPAKATCRRPSARTGAARAAAGHPSDEQRGDVADVDRRPRTALPDERAALVQLQRAFARTRYILRALTERERLDLSRRLTGVLAEPRATGGPRSR